MWRTAERRFVGHVRNPFLPFLLGIPCIHSLPEAWGSWEPQYTPPAMHYCIMPIALLRLQKKTCLMQRSRGFGHRVVVSKVCYNKVIVLSVVLCDCCKSMNNCRDWAFSNSGLEVGLSAFQLPIFETCDSLPKGDLLDMQGIHSFHSFWEFQTSTPYQKLEVPESHSTLHQLCIIASCPSLCCGCRKNLSHAEKQRVWSRSCGLQDLLQCSDCALSCAMWLLQVNEQLSRLSF